MPILKDLNEYAKYPNLEPKDVNVDNRYLLKLKDTFNADEVQHFMKDLGMRLFTYQFAHFYDFIPSLKDKDFNTTVEHLKDYDNKINNCKEDFNKIGCKITGKIKNTIPQINNGDANVEPDWFLHINFIDLQALPKVGVINTDDIPFETKEAAIYLRSVAAEIIRQYATNHYPELFNRNFMLIPANDASYVDSYRDIVSKVQDLSLTRDETLDLLKNKKCELTKVSLDCILQKDFTIIK
jgi:hypothetical protein